jgi:hypothetical protein
MKTSIRFSTIQGVKTKQNIRSSTIDDLPLLVARSAGERTGTATGS